MAPQALGCESHFRWSYALCGSFLRRIRSFLGVFMIKLFRDGKIWTVPNALSCFRLLLVPFIVWSYVGLENTTLTIILLGVSGLTDVLDGRIARRYNLTSALGKALDPLADKLTQVSIVLCLAFTYPLLWGLLGVCLVREPCIGVLAYVTMQKTNQVPGARWYGKLSTVVVYITVLSLLVFPELPKWLSDGLIIASIFCVVSALLLYTKYHSDIWKRANEQKAVD